MGKTLPAVNISETNDAITIEVAAPVMKKKDFSVELNDNQLCISYKKEMRHNDQDENKNVWRQENNFESFDRVFKIPESVNGEKINAEYEEGIFKITAFKKEEAHKKPSRMINIK